MALPVSVVVPHVRRRKVFFERFCLPSIEANEPAEIIVEENDGGWTGAHWRNEGSMKASSRFIFFCDDDVILARDCLAKLLHGLLFMASQAVRYAYCDLMVIVTEDGHKTQDHSVFVQKARDFDVLNIKRGSLCSAMLLIDREVLEPWDEKISQMDDWDLTLTLLKKGVHGVRVPEVLMHAYYLDAGVTNKHTAAASVHAVQAKHGMRPGG